MRRDRDRDRFGRGRGGRGGNRQGGRNDGSRRGGGRQRQNNRGRERMAAESGNERERIAIESGELVLIDQFMLANPQLVDKMIEHVDADLDTKKQLIIDYGGSVIDLAPGTYRIERDPYAFSIVVHPEDYMPEEDDLPELANENHGYVFIDTRCLAMVDRELLDDSALLQKYQQLWFSGQDKACRDLLRDNGGAVRYGFRRHGDELGIYVVPGENVVCLWPDIAEPQAEQAVEE